MRLLSVFIICFFLNSHLFAQASSYVDPAAAYLKVMLEKGSEGTYQQIGNFKVIGTSYLYGEKLAGSVFTKTEKSDNTNLSYNTYNQQLDIYLESIGQTISKTALEVDSFTIFSGKSEFLKNNLLFYSYRHVSPNSKAGFYQVLGTGARYNLYKSYSASLDIVSTNYIQSDLRQFTLEYNFYYLDNKTKEFKKLKLSKKKILDDFKSVLDLTPFLDNNEINNNPELALKKLFSVLNNY